VKEAKPLGIGGLAKQLILEGKSNAEVLAAVKAQFPECGANPGTIGWYRNNLKKSGKKVKDSRAITAKAKKAAKKAAASTEEAAATTTSDDANSDVVNDALTVAADLS